MLDENTDGNKILQNELINLNFVIGDLLNKITQPALEFATNAMKPLINIQNGWEEYILNNLYDHEQEELIGYHSLAGLDIAALLKIIDSNWENLYILYRQAKAGDVFFNKFSGQNNLYIKDIKTVRNKWAHYHLKSSEAEDYLKNILDFAKFISCNAELIKEISNKHNILGKSSVYVPGSTGTLKEKIENINTCISFYTKEQLDCWDKLITYDRCLIDGAAGTGKTLLAIQTAKNYVTNGETVGLFCYNSILGEYLDNLDWRDEQCINRKPAYVGSLHNYMLYKIINNEKQRDRKIRLIMPDGNEYFEEADKIRPELHIKYPPAVNPSDEFWENTVPQLTLDIIKKNERCFQKFDRIIVDEAQDVMIGDAGTSYLSIFYEILEGGLYNGKFDFFGDFFRQSLPPTTPTQHSLPASTALTHHLSKEQMKRLLGNYEEPPVLTVNCRNTRQITQMIQAITDFISPNYDTHDIEGPQVKFIQWSDIEDEKNKLNEELQRLQQEIDRKHITILTARSARTNDWWGTTVLSKLEGIDDKYDLHSDNVKWSTMFSYKGMEQEVIILTDIESYREDIKKIYVGMTRARSYLIIFESEAAKKERLNLHVGNK